MSCATVHLSRDPLYREEVRNLWIEKDLIFPCHSAGQGPKGKSLVSSVTLLSSSRVPTVWSVSLQVIPEREPVESLMVTCCSTWGLSLPGPLHLRTFSLT